MARVKLFIVLLIALFLFPVFKPLAAYSANGVHVCTLVERDCKHGEKCPLKSNHAQDKKTCALSHESHEGHGNSHDHNHGSGSAHNDSASNDKDRCGTYIECAGDASEGLLASALDQPFIADLQTFQNVFHDLKAAEAQKTVYKDPLIQKEGRPPPSSSDLTVCGKVSAGLSTLCAKVAPNPV